MSNETTFVFRLQDQTGSVGDGNQGSLAPPSPAPSDPGYGVPPGAPPRSTIPFPRARDAGAAAAGQAGGGELQTPSERLTTATSERTGLEKEQQAENARVERGLVSRSRQESNARIREHEAELKASERIRATEERARVAENQRRFSVADQRVEDENRAREARLIEGAEAAEAEEADRVETLDDTLNVKADIADAKEARRVENLETRLLAGADAADAEKARRQAPLEAAGLIPGVGRFARALRAGSPVAIAGAAAAGAAVAFRAVDQIGARRANELRYLSPEVATASAISDVSLLMRDITSAQKIGGVVAQHKIASTELEIAGKNFVDVIAKEVLPTISAQKEALAEIVNLAALGAEHGKYLTLIDDILWANKKVGEGVAFLLRKAQGKDDPNEGEMLSMLGGSTQTHLPDFPEIKGLPQEDRDDLDAAAAKLMIGMPE